MYNECISIYEVRVVIFFVFLEYILRMNIEKNQNKHEILKTDRLAQKMLKVENLKANLIKLTRISNKTSAQQSLLECSLTNNNESSSRLRVLSPNASPNSSFISEMKCKYCQKVVMQLKQEKIDKKLAQEKHRNLMQKYAQVSKQNQNLFKKISNLQNNLRQANQVMDPYKNNVILMQQRLASIKKSIVGNSDVRQEIDLKRERQFNERKRTMDFEVDFLKRTHEMQQENNETKINRLNFVINYMENKNKGLEEENAELHRKNNLLNSIIHESAYVIQQRELFHMASEELQQMKFQYSREKKEKEQLIRQVEKLKNKIAMLTSLIGYGVISNIENNDLQELSAFRQCINKMNVQEKVSYDACGLQSIKHYKYGHEEVVEACHQDQPHCCLYQPNFLIYFEDLEIKNALEESATTIIKPDFFLLIRAILDSKYSQFLIEKSKSNRFTEFVYSFIDVFRMKKKEKRIQLNPKRHHGENDYMKTNFLLRIFDRKIGFLPQIMTFRQFLVKNTPQDEVFYYLMSRYFIFDGPELDNYINCCDSYNFVPYSRAIQIAQIFLQSCDKSVKTVIFTHLSQKKVVKNRFILIKSNYMLRLLLEVYRKGKKQKITKVKTIFQQTSRTTKTKLMKFTYFKEILQKNFPLLTQTDICEHYRKSVAIYHSQAKETTFFQVFNATCLQYIFLQQNLELNEKIKRTLEEKDAQKIKGQNFILELIPDSVTQLGNETIYQQYMKFIKMKNTNLETTVKMSQFLLKIIQLRLYTISKTQPDSLKLSESLNEFNSKLIDCLNQDIKKRQKYEESLNKASSLIGKEFKKKIYQFYSQFVKDIKKQIDVKNK